MSDGAVHMSPRDRQADGLVIRYAETEAVEDETVLLLNPWPESRFAWNSIWSSLALTARLVAIDLPGFGQSERRAELQSPRAMGGFLLRLIDEWGLGHPRVVGPDVGTGAVLFAAAEDVGRFPSAVVGSGAASFPLEVTGCAQGDHRGSRSERVSGSRWTRTRRRRVGGHRATHLARGRPLLLCQAKYGNCEEVPFPASRPLR
jgi:pimeloyl-ACP methyl ester carboxylesterase